MFAEQKTYLIWEPSDSEFEIEICDDTLFERILSIDNPKILWIKGSYNNDQNNKTYDF